MSNQIHIEPAGSGKFSADVAGVSTNRIGDQIIVDTPQGKVSFNPDTLRTNSSANVTSDYKGGFFIAFPAAGSSTASAALGSAAAGIGAGAAAAGTIMGVPTLVFLPILLILMPAIGVLCFPAVVLLWMISLIIIMKSSESLREHKIAKGTFLATTLSTLIFLFILCSSWFITVTSNSPTPTPIEFIYALSMATFMMSIPLFGPALVVGIIAICIAITPKK